MEIKEISLNKIKLGHNSRLDVSKSELEGLMQSIKKEGLLQPIGVVKRGTSYEIAYGNRRFLAMSKLGRATIPAVVQETEEQTDVDIMNLTENIQRRNISLMEIGRYINTLKASNLSNAEIAVRLGVEKSYVETCEDAYRRVPEDYRGSIETKFGKGTGKQSKAAPGKITVAAARKIMNAASSYRLKIPQQKRLLEAAKNPDTFNTKDIPLYARALAEGHEDFLGVVPTNKFLSVNLIMRKEDYERVREKYVDNGEFKSIRQLFAAILRGEKHAQVKVR